MWVMTSWGVLMPGLRPKEHVPAGDNREIQIRARRRIELERVCAFYPELELRKEDIVYFDFTDYEYRIFCTKEQLGSLLALIAMDVNYVKFKSSTERFKEEKLHLFYNRVWGIYYDMFSTNRYLEKLTFGSPKTKKKNRHHQDKPLPPRRHWWEDVDRTERTETF
jgi:hypothetical protein